MAAASDSLTPVVLELGGKDPMVLCDDADFSQSCNVAMRGFFQNCGQNCIGLERLVVQAPIYDRVVDELTKRVRALRQVRCRASPRVAGPTQAQQRAHSDRCSCGVGATGQGAPLEEEVDVGAMTMPNAWVKLEDLVKDAVAKGARLLAGGKRLEHPTWTHGFYFAPTVLADVTPDMKIAQEEVFGPVVVIMRFTTDEEALHIVNSAPYGLGASVFSSNAERAERLVRGIRSGMCNVNDFAVNYLCQSLPFGGVKISGFDRFAGPEGLRGNCLVRVRHARTLAGMGGASTAA